jgi:hypothetical protein
MCTIYELFLKRAFILSTALDLLGMGVILEIIFVSDEIQFLLSVQITDSVLRN